MLVLSVEKAIRDKFGNIDEKKSDGLVIHNDKGESITIYLEAGIHGGRIKVIVSGDEAIPVIRKKRKELKEEAESMN